MMLVADTNILFSFFNNKSKAREILFLSNLDVYSPKFSLEEIEKHKKDILKKFSLNENQFSLIIKLLNTMIKFCDKKFYANHLNKSKEISPDKDDVDFLALALKLGCSLWTEDKKLKEQSLVEVLTTTDLMDKLEIK